MRRHLLHDKFEKPEISDHRPSLLLHVCCAPCMSVGIEELIGYFDITIYFYNPNLILRSEYERRLAAVKKLVAEICPDVRIIDGGYDPAAYCKAVGDQKSGKEHGEKCRLCMAARLEAAAEECARLGIEYCGTTLTASRMKNADFINSAGERAAAECGVKWLHGDLKKRNGCDRTKELCLKYDIYRQSYCGCTPQRITVAVTGGIASGKSTFVGMLAELGAYTISADEVTRELEEPGTEVYQRIVSAFPGCADGGKLDRKILAEKVFADVEKRRLLESIVHPAVKAEMIRRAEEKAAPITVYEIPLLYESGMSDIADITVTVSATEEERMRRAESRSGMTAEMFSRVVGSQWTDDMREKEADIVVVNDGKLSSLTQKAKELYTEWLKIIGKV